MDERSTGCVVVGIENSIAGLRALRFAVAEARRRGTELHAIRVWTIGSPGYGTGITCLRSDLAEIAGAVAKETFQCAMGGPPADVPAKLVLLEGDPATALVEYAQRDDDLLVVGASRHRWRSVSRACAGRAHCPVLVVPPPEFARHVRRSVRAIRRDVRGWAALDEDVVEQRRPR